jgi:hypothetical protein
MNEAVEGVDAGGNVSEAAAPISEWNGSPENDRSIEPDFTDTMKDMGLDPNDFGFKSGFEEEEKETNEAASEEPQGSGEEAKPGLETDENGLLELVNSLGAIHNDSPVSVASKDELKNLIQMGKDYTVKTQSLSEERKAFESDRDLTREELNGAINEFNNQTKAFDEQFKELQSLRFTLKELEQRDPDLFSEFSRVQQDVHKQFSNPILDQQLQEIRAELAETKKGLSVKENKATLAEFDREKSLMSATEQSMKELGVTIDWELAKQEWASTGLPLSKVVGSIYLENVAKAQASKSKVDNTRAKVQAKPTGAASNNRPGSKVPQISKKLSAFEYAQEYLKQIS